MSHGWLDSALTVLLDNPVDSYRELGEMLEASEYLLLRIDPHIPNAGKIFRADKWHRDVLVRIWEEKHIDYVEIPLMED